MSMKPEDARRRKEDCSLAHTEKSPVRLTVLQHAELSVELAKADAFNEAATSHLDRSARHYDIEYTLLEKALRKALEILEGAK